MRKGRKGFCVQIKASCRADRRERWGIMTASLIKRARIFEEMGRRKGKLFLWAMFGSYAVQCVQAAERLARRKRIVHHLHNHFRDIGLAGFGIGPLLDKDEKDSPQCGGGVRFFGFGSSVTVSQADSNGRPIDFPGCRPKTNWKRLRKAANDAATLRQTFPDVPPFESRCGDGRPLLFHADLTEFDSSRLSQSGGFLGPLKRSRGCPMYEHGDLWYMGGTVMQ